MEVNDELLHKMWACEQEILDVVHAFCEKNHIKYSLFYGTLLGAVRHAGFIPWDDDIDVAMPRADYEKFRRIWLECPVEGYVLQDYNTDKDYTNNFMKIRKDHTTFLHSEEEGITKKYHKGIFVDIFPMDRIAPTKASRKIQYFESAVNLLYSRGFQSGTGGAVGAMEKILLTFPKSFQYAQRNVAEKRIKRWNNSAKTDYFCACTIADCKRYYPADMFDSLKKISFNGKKYYSMGDPDRILTIRYGNYMQLPPKEEQVWKHHPVYVAFDHNYGGKSEKLEG